MNWFFKAKISRFCVANLVNSGLFPAICALNRTIFSLENFNPDLIRGSLKISLFSLFLFFQVCMSQGVLAKGKEKTHIVLTGSSTVAPLASEIARLFEKKHPGVFVDVQTGGSSRGIADARRGLADIGMVSRNLKKNEADLNAFSIAFDGVTMILHKNNPVSKLSHAEIIAIYRGQIKNWKKVGGRDASITVVNKAEGHSTLELFTRYFELKNSEIHPDVIIGDNAQGIKTVSGNPDAIGYVSIGAARVDVAWGAPIKLLPVAKVSPTLENVQNGHFPIRRPLNFVTKKIPAGWVKAFIQFARSKEVRAVIQEQSFVPIAP